MYAYMHGKPRCVSMSALASARVRVHARVHAYMQGCASVHVPVMVERSAFVAHDHLCVCMWVCGGVRWVGVCVCQCAPPLSLA